MAINHKKECEMSHSFLLGFKTFVIQFCYLHEQRKRTKSRQF